MKRIAIVALTLLIAAAVVVPAHAQTTQGPALGALYASADPTGYVGEFPNAPQFAQFNWYLVIDIDFGDIGKPEQNTSNGVVAWDGRVTVPAAITVSSNVVSPATSIDIGTKTPPNFDYIVGTGQNVSIANPVAVVTFSGFILAPTPENVIVRVGPPALASIPGTPSWGEFSALNGCEVQPGRPTECLFPFAETRNLVLNTGPIDNDESSFGSLKSRFD